MVTMFGFKLVFTLLWLIYPFASVFADDELITEVTNNLKATLAKKESKIRLPLKASTRSNAESTFPGANTAPSGSEYWAADKNERLMQTEHVQHTSSFKATGNSKTASSPKQSK